MSLGQSDPESGIVGVFSRAADAYDRIGPPVFAHFGRWLVERTSPAAGASVLDVATGRGAVLFPAARKVGPTGRAVGLDLSAAMVQETAADIGHSGWRHIEVKRGDAEHLDFPDASFDQVLCGFALWFFPHPEHALREFFRVLKPGGVIGVTAWAQECPVLRWCLDELASCLPAMVPGQSPSPNFDATESIGAALRQAGFGAVETEAEEADFIYRDEEEWWLSLWTTGIRRRLEGLEQSELHRVKTQMLRAAQVLKRDGGVHTKWRALLGLARKPFH